MVGSSQTQVLSLSFEPTDRGGFDSRGVSARDLLGGLEWKFTSLRATLATLSSANNLKYVDHMLALRLSRRTPFYVWKAVVPLFGTAVLLSMVFCVNLGSDENVALRITVCVTLYFSIFAILWTLSGRLPKTPVLHYIDKLANAALILVLGVAAESAILHAQFNKPGLDIELLKFVDMAIASGMFAAYIAYKILFILSVRSYRRNRDIEHREPVFGPMSLKFAVLEVHQMRPDQLIWTHIAHSKTP